MKNETSAPSIFRPFEHLQPATRVQFRASRNTPTPPSLRLAGFEDSLPDVASWRLERQGRVGSFRRRGEVGSTKRLVPWAILLCRLVPIVRSPVWRSFLGERPDQTPAFGQGIRQPSHHGELSGSLAG
jgi:hypothetical protein